MYLYAYVYTYLEKICQYLLLPLEKSLQSVNTLQPTRNLQHLDFALACAIIESCLQ